jgi:DNA-binding HxlR family transcriptional regulator
MRGYGQFCPVAKACEVLGERWTLVIVRELVAGGRRFNDIRRGAPLISPSLLSKRLGELQNAGVIRRVKRGRALEYELTAAGEELRPMVELMGVWGQKWARSRYGPDDLDISLLMWDLRRNVDPTKFPPGRFVLRFHFDDAPPKKRSFWLINEDGIADLCLTDPGFEVDLEISSDVANLTRVWMGDLPLERALASGAILLEGNRELIRRFRAWLQLSSFAAIMPAVTASRAQVAHEL